MTGKGGLLRFQTLFSNFPGRTNLTQHRINRGDARPVALPPYFPNSSSLAKEIKDMLDLGVIVPFKSP